MKKLLLYLILALNPLLLLAQEIDFHEPVKVFESEYDLIRIIRTGDIDGDEITDLIVSSGSVLNDTIYVLKGDGAGNFTPFFKRKVGSMQDLKVLDMDNDDDLDIVLSLNSSAVLGLLVNDGNGDFESIKTYHAGGYVQTMTVADFNGDDYPDVAIPVTHELDPTYKYISVFLNNGNGTMQTRQQYMGPTTISTTFYVNALDMNDDGYIDVVQPYVNKDSILIYINGGDGTFNNWMRQQIPTSVTTIQVKDLDHDEREDLVLIGRRPSGWLPQRNYLFGFYLQKENNEDDNIVQEHENIYKGQIFGGHDVSDVDKDGEYDITLAPRYYDEGNDSFLDSLVLYLNQGELTFDIFSPAYKYKMENSPIGLMMEDLNGDGLLDYIFSIESVFAVQVMFQKDLTTTSVFSPSSAKATLNVYPNPSTGLVYIDLNKNIQKVMLYDSMGRLIKEEEQVNQNSLRTIDLSGESKGLYLLRVESEDGFTTSKQLILE